MIKYQTGKIYLAATIKIGRRLTVAKALLKDGEWGMEAQLLSEYGGKPDEGLQKVREQAARCFRRQLKLRTSAQFDIHPGGDPLRSPGRRTRTMPEIKKQAAISLNSLFKRKKSTPKKDPI